MGNKNDIKEKIRAILTSIADASKEFSAKPKWEEHDLAQLSYGVNDKPWVIKRQDLDEWNEIINMMQALNPDMVSNHGARQRLETLVVEIQKKMWDFTKIDDDIDECIDDLKNFKTNKVSVWFPVVNLNIGSEPLLIGNVVLEHWTTSAVAKEEMMKEHLDRLNKEMSNRIFCVAQTSACGDDSKILETAKQNMEYALNVLRAFLITAIFSGVHQIWTSCSSSHSTDVVFWGSTTAGFPADRPVKFKESYSGTYNYVPLKLNTHWRESLIQHNFNTVSDILKKASGSRNQIERKVIRGLFWLGEATLDDNLESSFIKVAFGLEAIIGGESSKIPPDSIRTQLAERAAFIINGPPQHLLEVDQDVRKYVGMRNDIAHGREVLIKKEDIRYFSFIVLEVAIKLLSLMKDPKIKLENIEDLQKWILNRRYGTS